MKIAIISDTHGRHELVERAVKLIDAATVELTIHCGDIDDADTVWLFQPNTHFVWGNCDREKTSLRQAMHGIGATCHEYAGKLQIGGKKLAFAHGDDERLLDDLAHSGQFDFVFHGHTHKRAEHTVGTTRVINPGALHRVNTRTFCLLDLETGEIETCEVE